MQRKLQNISIVNRLTGLCSLSAFLVLFGLSYFLYIGFVSIIHKSNRQSLRDEIHYIKDVIKHNKNFVDKLDVEFSWVPSVVRENNNSDNWVSPYDYLRIVDEKNQILSETPGLKHIISSRQFSKLIGEEDAIMTQLRVGGKSHYYLLMSDAITIKPHTYHLQLALDITALENIIQSYRYLIIAATLCAALIIALLGRWIVKRCMSALTQLTHMAATMTVQDDKAQISAKSWPSELQPLALALDNTLKKIKESYQRLAQFSANLAHELRTPLNNLIGATEVMLIQSRSTEEYQQQLSSNLEEFRRMANLIQRLLFLARADEPNFNIHYTDFSVADELSLSCDYFQILAEENNILLSYKGEAQLSADLTLFRLALNNLLDNAIKYIEPNGQVCLSVLQDDKQVMIQINDSGKGVAQEHIPHLFSRFYRAPASQKNKQGFGLGLAIVQSIMKLHQGKVRIYSELNQGTSVILTFPKQL